ncbi:MAG TPA: SusC/RagA family TonB-linked outer membrane protein [Bacteroidales bacterium]|nr:SusC/RagA family TonB-linked outer membrane protein [Bacteroidales bacterium]
MKKLSLLICLLVVSFSTLIAQTKVITGTVTSAVQGEGTIPGVTVQVQGTTVATATDANGKYSLTVPADAKILVFTYIGMKKLEVEIGGRAVVDAVMESETQGLTEVVVTAFGIKRAAKELGVATQKVSDQELTQAGVTNVVNGLTAKVSGLQINTVNNGVNPDTRITLRGNRHFLASNQALVVLDGVPVDASYLNSINPNDIDNVNVLKGASAAALYGNDASNGVLVVTTKKGTGAKPIIKISNTTTFETVSYMPNLQTRFGQGSNEDTISYLPNYTFWIGQGRYTNPYTSFENQSYGPQFNGQNVILGGLLADGSYQTIKYSYVPDAKKKFFNTGITTQDDISYSVGDQKNSFYISVQDVNTTGTIPKDKNRRSGIRVAGTSTSGIFHAEYSVGYTRTNTNTSGTDPYQSRPVYWFVLNTPQDVDLTNYKDIVNNKFANNNGYFNAYYSNPYWQIDNSRYITIADNLLGSALFSLSPAKWIDVSYRVGLTYSGTDASFYREAMTFNSYMKADPWHAGSEGASSPYVGVAYDQMYTNFIMTGDFLVSMNQKIGDFTGKLILGNSMLKDQYRLLYMGNNSLVIPGLYNIAYRLGEAAVTETRNDRNSMGVFGDLTLGFRNYAFIHASARNDWDSRLTKENRSFFYPGVDASVILSDAIPSLKDNAVLSFFKIRGGWSKTGQIALSNWYATVPSFTSGVGTGAGFPYGNLAGYQLSTTLSNAKLKPEQTQEVELGTELGFLKSRINLGLNVYKSNTKDQTIPARLSYATGYESAYINAGELMSEGIEADLKITPIVKAGDFTWDAVISYTYQTNKVVSIMPGLSQLFINDVSYAVVGQQFPSIMVTDFQRDSQGRIIVDPQSGYPTTNPALYNAGHGNPNHLLGLTSTFNWKGLSLNIVADYRTGNVIQNAVGNDLDFTGISEHSGMNGRQDFVIPNSVVNMGTAARPDYEPNTTVITKGGGWYIWTQSPVVSSHSMITYLTSAAFWKVREVSLNYEVPVKNILGGKVKGLQLGLIGRNLLMFRPKTNGWADPEFNQQNGASNAVGYTTVYQTPPTRVMGFSVKFTF